MTKKVAKRGWSLEKFTEAVKAGCERAGQKFRSSKVQNAYDSGYTVAYTISQMGAGEPTRVQAKKAA